MERPWLAFLVLIGIAIGAIAITGRGREVERPMTERIEQRDEEERLEKARQNASAYASMSEDDPRRLKAYDALGAGTVKGEIEVENVGVIQVELYPQSTPKTVEHIVQLAKKGYYNGIRFHRLVPDFVVQTGDPKSKTFQKKDFEGKTAEQVGDGMGLGTGGSGAHIPLEQKLPHLAYTLGLARANTPDSGDSQFFINLKDNHNLDTGYCAFGRVTGGQDVVKRIQMGDAIKSFKILN
jgi:cyclophilin family peptidyl-prolyl cis-trans isomerase